MRAWIVHVNGRLMEVLCKLYGICRLQQGSPCKALSALWVYENTNKQERGSYGLISALMRYGLKQWFARYEFRGRGGQPGRTETRRETQEGGYKAFCCACGIRIPPKGFCALEGYYMYCVRGAIFVKYFLKIN